MGYSCIGGDVGTFRGCVGSGVALGGVGSWVVGLGWGFVGGGFVGGGLGRVFVGGGFVGWRIVGWDTGREVGWIMGERVLDVGVVG